MYFFIDGYNFLFSLVEEMPSLQRNRDQMVQWLCSQFSEMDLKGMLVFDGSHRREEQSGLTYHSALEIMFTPKGQSADAYILEALALVANPKSYFVVTNDRGLTRQAQAARASVQTSHSFLSWLTKHSLKKQKKRAPRKESSAEIERLTKIFEERLKREDLP
jgi:predicted RNA-binding protein with PIN domain